MRRWLLGARPRTLPAAVVPVLVGTSLAAGSGIIWWRALAALVVALALQVAVNYANDLSDGVRGTDGPERVGPQRLVGSGLATAQEVRLAMLGAFGVAAMAGEAEAPKASENSATNRRIPVFFVERRARSVLNLRGVRPSSQNLL